MWKPEWRELIQIRIQIVGDLILHLSTSSVKRLSEMNLLVISHLLYPYESLMIVWLAAEVLSYC